MSQIICRNVSLGYNGEAVCKNLNFTIEQGDYLCIVGDNGSGKSTLMKALLDIHAPLSGEIVRGDGMSAGSIGYLPQQSELQRDFPATVGEVTLSGCIGNLGHKFFYSKSDKMQAHDAMKQLGICDLADKPYNSLSGGQQQRALLARALCAAKKIILLDEPVSGLDPVAASDMYETISALNKSMGITVIMVTHDISASLKYASRILHMGANPQFFKSVAEYMTSDMFSAREVK